MQKPASLLPALVMSAAIASSFCVGSLSAADAVPGLSQRPAVISPSAVRESMLGAARAGQRLVAVGDRGVILLSDDDGATFRQARQVPTRATLTSVVFAHDHKTGWAVGHWGVILNTRDAGENWTLVRSDTTVDQPLFSVTMVSDEEGFATGLWSLLLRTSDGGKTWNNIDLSGKGKNGAGLNLFSAFSSPKGTLFITSEQGTVYRSVDRGMNWTELQTGGKGTLWTGIGLENGAILVAGITGKIYRSTDDGVSWSEIESHTRNSITSLTQLPNGKVIGAGLNGLKLISDDGGLTFKAEQDAQGIPLNAVISNNSGRPVFFSMQGPVAPKNTLR
jgi:photosystem II stability/assembly factor-like uncharacterized protein